MSNKQQPYVYFPSPSSIKKDSTKIPHFLRIAEFYRSLLMFEHPRSFIFLYKNPHLDTKPIIIYLKEFKREEEEVIARE
ncbi:MAG: hypothetical protein ACXVNF_14655 [Neobacillus sp.]